MNWSARVFAPAPSGGGGPPAVHRLGRRLTVVVLLVTLLILAGIVFVYLGLYLPPSSLEPGGVPVRSVRLTVESGMPFSSVCRRLHRLGLIRYPRVVSFYAAARGYDRRVYAGTYQFHTGQVPKDILKALFTGDVLKVAVTIPEGYTIRQIASTVAETAGLDSTAFSRVAVDPVRRAEWGISAASLEGYLFPDTYWIPWGCSEETVVDMMLSRLSAVFDGDLERRSRSANLTRHQVLTLASIIEAEARLPRERELIAAVYRNRLRRHMKLEADPTVCYALGGYKGRLLFKDLQVDSPYNTYLNYGLPPGPICNPGEASIRAVLYPDSTSRALYFVARGDGSHIFSLTLKDHLAAVKQARLSNKK